MYLITKYGWFSVVAAVNDHGRPDLERIVIRARSQDFFKRLSAACPILRNHKPERTPDRDYRYRIVVDRETWIRVAAWNAEQVTYTNVKEEISRVHRPESAYSTAVHQTWAVGLRNSEE